MLLFPAAALAGSIRSGVGGRRGAAQNEKLVVQKEPGTHSQARLHLGIAAGLGQGWRRVRPSPFPACSHGLSQDVAALPCAEQDRGAHGLMVLCLFSGCPTSCMAFPALSARAFIGKWYWELVTNC